MQKKKRLEVRRTRHNEIQSAAVAVMRESETLQLGERAREQFMHALLHPPARERRRKDRQGRHQKCVKPPSVRSAS